MRFEARAIVLARIRAALVGVMQQPRHNTLPDADASDVALHDCEETPSLSGWHFLPRATFASLMPAVPLIAARDGTDSTQRLLI